MSSGSHAGIIVLLVAAVFELAMAVVFIWAWFSILKKAGYSGWMALLGLIPLVNIVLFFFFAFSKWPVQHEVEQLRAGAGGQGGYPGAPGGYPAQGGAYPPSAPGGYPQQGGYPGR